MFQAQHCLTELSSIDLNYRPPEWAIQVLSVFISKVLLKPRHCQVRHFLVALVPRQVPCSGVRWFASWLVEHSLVRQAGYRAAQTLTSLLPCSFQQGGESDGFFHLDGQPQRPPEPPEVRQQPARKVTLTKGALPQPQHLPGGAHVHSAGPPGIRSIQGIHPAKKVRLRPIGAPGCEAGGSDGRECLVHSSARMRDPSFLGSAFARRSTPPVTTF